MVKDHSYNERRNPLGNISTCTPPILNFRVGIRVRFKIRLDLGSGLDLKSGLRIV